jgi:hypothetical protein
MVIHWVRTRTRGWRARAFVNGFGACCTAVVLVVVAVTKFIFGAWIVCLLIPALVVAFRAMRRHYDYVAERLSLSTGPKVLPAKNLSLVLVGGMHRGTLEAMEYAKALGGELRAVHVEAGGSAEPRILKMWEQYERDVPLVIIPCPYRNLAGPLIEYIDKVRKEEGYTIVTVILPEFVVDSWWESLLHNHSALVLQLILSQVPYVATLNMRYKL